MTSPNRIEFDGRSWDVTHRAVVVASDAGVPGVELADAIAPAEPTDADASIVAIDLTGLPRGVTIGRLVRFLVDGGRLVVTDRPDVCVPVVDMCGDLSFLRVDADVVTASDM